MLDLLHWSPWPTRPLPARGLESVGRPIWWNFAGRTHSVLAGDEVVIEPLLDDVAEDLWASAGVEVGIEPGDEGELTILVSATDTIGLSAVALESWRSTG